MSFGPTIETLQDWNDRLTACGCCTIDVPAPTRDCQYVNLTSLELCGSFGLAQTGMSGLPEEDEPAYVRTTVYRNFVSTNNRDTTTGLGVPCHWDRVITISYSPYYELNWGCVTTKTDVQDDTSCPFLPSFTTTYSATGTVNGFSATRTQTNGLPDPTLNDVLVHSYSNPILDTLEWLIERGQATFEYRGGWGAVSGISTGCTTNSRVIVTQLLPDDRDLPAVITWTRQRFRWHIDEDFTGSYFKITWDVVNVAAAGGTSYHLIDQTWEWTGPGDPDDADSWLSGWYDIDPPEFEGERRVVNIRYTPFSVPTSWGLMPPDVMGESLEPEPSALAFDDENNSGIITII